MHHAPARRVDPEEVAVSPKRTIQRFLNAGLVAVALLALSGCLAYYEPGYGAGVYVDHVPRGSIVFRYRGHPHYFHDGRFYRRHTRGYAVIDLPRGAVLPRLPRGGRSYRRHGVEYKEYRGVVYERVERGRERGYKVRGRARGRRGHR